jgi:hypothetical protein
MQQVVAIAHTPCAFYVPCLGRGKGQGARGKGQKQCNAPYAIYRIGILLGIRDLT